LLKQEIEAHGIQIPKNDNSFLLQGFSQQAPSQLTSFTKISENPSIESYLTTLRDLLFRVVKADSIDIQTALLSTTVHLPNAPFDTIDPSLLLRDRSPSPPMAKNLDGSSGPSGLTSQAPKRKRGRPVTKRASAPNKQRTLPPVIGFRTATTEANPNQILTFDPLIDDLFPKLQVEPVTSFASTESLDPTPVSGTRKALIGELQVQAYHAELQATFEDGEASDGLYLNRLPSSSMSPDLELDALQFCPQYKFDTMEAIDKREKALSPFYTANSNKEIADLAESSRIAQSIHDSPVVTDEEPGKESSEPKKKPKRAAWNKGMKRTAPGKFEPKQSDPSMTTYAGIEATEEDFDLI
jgi:hypothetical protein